MAKVTSRFQVTVPRTIANRYQIRPGDDIDWVAAGEVIRVIPARKQPAPQDRDSRLRWFDQATERQQKRTSGGVRQRLGDRGWTRQNLYRLP